MGCSRVVVPLIPAPSVSYAVNPETCPSLNLLDLKPSVESDRKTLSTTDPVAIEPLARSDLASANRLLKGCVDEGRMSSLVLQDDLGEHLSRHDVVMLKAVHQSHPGLTNQPM